jgi:hypothetical protein
MKEYIFWKKVKKEITEECVINANSLDEAVKIHNEGGADYEETHCSYEQIIDEGVQEIETKENKNDKQGIRHNQVV